MADVIASILILLALLPARWYDQDPSLGISPLAFGAKCDGVTDDGGALQKALDAAGAVPGGWVLLPPRVCAFSRPLIVGGARGRSYSHVNIRGASEDVSRLAFTGNDTSADVALFFKHVAYFRAEGFALIGPANTKKHAGRTVGILIGDNTNTGGTMATGGSFTHVAVSGFHIGMIVGDTDAGSEITCNQCRFQWNDIGFTSNNQNSLNFWFHGLDISNNAIGVAVGGPHVSDGPRIYGGAAAANDIDFSFGNAFGNTIISGFRSEGAGLFISGTPHQLRVDSVTVTPSVNRDGRLIDTLESQIDILNSEVNGSWRHAGGAISLRNSLIRSTHPDFPIDVRTPDGGQGSPTRYRFSNNFRLASGQPTMAFPDVEGVYAFSDGVLMNQVTQQQNWDAATGRTEPGVLLPGVKSLAAGSTVLGRNLRDSVTFESSATAAFTFTRTLTVSTSAGSQIITALTGRFRPSDVGKKIVIANGATDCGYAKGPAPGHIAGVVRAYTDAAHIVFGAGPATATDDCRASFSNQARLTATVGENEPDAGYFVVGLACNADERFWWSAIAPTGFTLTSSNPNSTATCNFLVVR